MTATFDADFLDPQRYNDVLACSAFPDPGRLDCGRACLRLAKDELRRQDRERADGRAVAALAVG